MTHFVRTLCNDVDDGGLVCSYLHNDILWSQIYRTSNILFPRPKPFVDQQSSIMPPIVFSPIHQRRNLANQARTKPHKGDTPIEWTVDTFCFDRIEYDPLASKTTQKDWDNYKKDQSRTIHIIYTKHVQFTVVTHNQSLTHSMISTQLGNKSLSDLQR